MTDIVERLRDGSFSVDLCREAADELERLRAVLQNIADYNIGTRVMPGETTDAANIRAIRDIAREAI